MKLFYILPLLLPFTASAAGYTLLAPLGPLSGSVSLEQYLGGIIQVAIGTAGVLAVVMIVICGIQLMGTPSVSQKNASKECITNAVIGLLLAIGSWVILNTINPELLRSDANLAVIQPPAAVTPPAAVSEPRPSAAGWYYAYSGPGNTTKYSQRYPSVSACNSAVTQAKADGLVTIDTPAGSGLTCFEVFAPPPGQPAPPSGTIIEQPASEKAARNLLCGNDSCVLASPYGVNKGPCTPSNPRSCTNLAGLPQSTILAIKKLADLSSLPVMITGGTEPGHKTHLANKPIFDLRKTNALNQWIRSNATKSATSFVGCRYRLTLNGNHYWFTDEGDHWHTCELNQPFWYCKDSTRSGTPITPDFYVNCPNN